MSNELDPRLLQVTIDIDGQRRVYDGLRMACSGTKFANALQNEATIKITNLAKEVRDHILTETSPFNRPRRRCRVIIEAGRVSTGLHVLFTGDVMESQPSQPPDIDLTLKCKTGGFFKTDMIGASYGDVVPMSTIAGDVANSMGLSLIYEAPEKNISNYNYSGSRLQQVDELSTLGSVNAYVDDDRLIVKQRGSALKTATMALSRHNGMVGIPEITEQGVKVKMMLAPLIRCGGRIDIVSDLNPAADGAYIIYKLSFDVANRDTPFYSIAECQRIGLWPLTRF